MTNDPNTGPKKVHEETRRTGPSTGNNSGNDLPSDAETMRDTRELKGTLSNEDAQTRGEGDPLGNASPPLSASRAE